MKISISFSKRWLIPLLLVGASVHMFAASEPEKATVLLFSDWSNRYRIPEALQSKEIVASPAINDYLSQRGIRLEILPHPGRDASDSVRLSHREELLKYGIADYPTALALLDKNKNLIGRWLGFIKDKEELLKWLKKPTRQISERNVDDNIVVTFEKKRTTVKDLRERSLMLYAVGTLLPGTIAPYEVHEMQEAIGNAIRKMAVEGNGGRNSLEESQAANSSSLLVCGETEAWREVDDEEDRWAIYRFLSDGTFTWAMEYGDQGGRRIKLGAGTWRREGDLLQVRSAYTSQDFSGDLPEVRQYKILSLAKETLKLSGLKIDLKTGKPVETVFKKIKDWSND